MKHDHIYCTLFNSAFLTRGLAMILSLQHHDRDAQVAVFCMDQGTEDVLKELNLPSVIIIGLKNFEDSELLKAKIGRSVGEYCWTCTPSVCLYCLEALGFKSCTYLDADLFFYNSPSLLLSTYAQYDIWITSHRYTPRYDQSATSGIYCVQFMHFKNSERGMEALRWWRAACLAWCYARFEDGKFGDQKYLDDWIERFQGVIALPDIGVGVAPWNVLRHQYTLQDGSLHLSEGGSPEPLIFYHFHAFQSFKNGHVDLGTYEIPLDARVLLYRPYVQALGNAERMLQKMGVPDHRPLKMKWGRRLKRALTGKLYYFQQDKV